MTLQAGRIYGGVGRLGAARQGGIPAWLYGDYGGSGGARIDASNCVVAYCPIGAASYAASKVNLANPGTNNAYEGAQPGWTAADGWSFTNAAKNLYSDYTVMAGRDSIIIGVTLGANIGYITGVFSPKSYYLRWMGADRIRFANNDVYTDVAGPFGGGTSHVFCMAGGGGCYVDGAPAATLSPGAPTQLTTRFTINGIYLADYNYGVHDLKVRAAWIYNVSLTAAQAAGLTAAMNAITSAGNYYL